MDEEIEGMFQEELITHPARLISVIEACEILNMGWSCEKEGVELRGEDGEVEHVAVHYRFRIFIEPKMVSPEIIQEFDL